MTYYLNIAQAGIVNGLGSVATNGAVALTLKAASFIGRKFVSIPSPSFTGVASSGVVTGNAVVYMAFATQSQLYRDLNHKLSLSPAVAQKVRSIAVFAVPFFLTLLGVPWLMTKMGCTVAYQECGFFAALDLALFATHINWRF